MIAVSGVACTSRKALSGGETAVLQHKMSDALDCEVCLERFDELSRRPKLLGCGHTVCLHCVERIHRRAGTDAKNTFLCPMDRKETSSTPKDLNDNFYILSLIDQSKPRSAAKKTESPRFWCLECEAVADEVCIDKHTICRLQKHRKRQLKDTLDLLEKSVTTQRRLRGMLQEIVPKIQSSIQQEVEGLSQALESSQKSLDVLYDNLELVGPEWDEAFAAIESARQRCEASMFTDERSVDFLRLASRCEITVHGSNGTKWHGDINLEGESSSVAFAFITAMERARTLQVVEETAAAAAAPVQPVNLSQQPDTKCIPVSDPPPTVNTDSLDWLAAFFKKEPAIADLTRKLMRDGNNVSKVDPKPYRVVSVADISKTSSRERRTEKDDLLMKFDGKGEDIALTGLYCDVDPGWACALLNVVGPRLVFLEALQVSHEHLCCVDKATSLRTLVIRSTSRILSAPETYRHGVGCLPNLERLRLDVPYKDFRDLVRRYGFPSRLEVHAGTMPIEMQYELLVRPLLILSLPQIGVTMPPSRTLTLIRDQASQVPNHRDKCKESRNVAKSFNKEVRYMCSLCDGCEPIDP